MEFNEKLQELRKQKGLTQEELAETLYVSRAAISKWESGRGYPNIESLKAIAKFFSVTIDELLSGDEVLTIAEEEHRQKERHLRDVVFGLLDCSAAMFFFLPFFGQRAEGAVQVVSLLSLTGTTPWLRVVYAAVVAGMALWGVLTLALQGISRPFRGWSRSKLSFLLNVAGVLLFIIGMQPYAAAFLFVFLIIKVWMLVKWP